MRDLFMRLLEAGTEDEVQAILDVEGLASDDTKWTPYGNNESFYGVVENQQAHPVPALVEKVTNGIDAILERKVREDGVGIRSPEAPRSVQEALDRYFPDHRNWDLGDARRRQARDLQIVASGPRRDTSLMVYDNGVGQAPADFHDTFLSLLRGNKNDVHFVQGKYNMGGAGAIAFCGDRRFQLVASKRYDGSAPLGFTLLRRHPPARAEAAGRKNTWYEYLVFDGSVASMEIDELDVGLDGRNFRTGSLLKIYSYRLPEGARSIISRDLNLSLNEFLFEPALPFLTVDSNKRYPDNRAPVTPVYGLKRRLAAAARNFWSDPDHALIRAHRDLEEAVREKAGISDEEAAAGPARIYATAFNKGGRLHWPGIGDGEQVGRANLFLGAVGAYRNPRAHRNLRDRADLGSGPIDMSVSI